MQRKQGENVSLGWTGKPSTEVAETIVVYDSNGNVRTLQPWERLVVDVLIFDTQATDTMNLAYVTYGTVAPTILPTVAVVASFTANQGIPGQGAAFPGEGYNIPTGNNLYLLLVGDAWNGAQTSITGTARIINGKTPGVRANYKELLTAGGNTNGQ